jgi:aryl-alcohol dehydrogenase-like predicted oxidoreductase
MNKLRPLGKSGISISAVMFGAWAIGGWLWGGTDEQQSINAIRAALDMGINSIDTAAVYAQGFSEELVGRAIKDVPRDQVILATKCGRRWDDPKQEGSNPLETQNLKGETLTIRSNSKPYSIAYECEQSLKRLAVDYIDLYQIHQLDATTPVEESMAAMEQLRKAGKIRAIGVSNYNAEMIARAAAAGPLSSVQPPYSLLRRDIEKDILPLCHREDIAVLAYSPLERGLLTGKVSPERQFSPGDHRVRHKLFDVENRKKVLASLEKISAIAARHHATPAQVAINWTIQQPGVTAAIVGARSPQQARENAGALAFELTADELQAVAAAF